MRLNYANLSILWRILKIDKCDDELMPVYWISSKIVTDSKKFMKKFFKNQLNRDLYTVECLNVIEWNFLIRCLEEELEQMILFHAKFGNVTNAR